jgi:Flp pilus assembly pilin Flp
MLSKVWTIFQNLRHDEDGATMVEYGLLVALIAMVAIVGNHAARY